MSALIYKAGTPKARSFPLKLGLNGIGRNEDNQVCLNRADVSRYHAEIAVTPERVMLKDLGSSNHTFVNGRKVTITELSDGDEVRFSTIRLSYREADVDVGAVDETAADDAAALASEIADKGRVEDGVTPGRRAELVEMVADMSAVRAVGALPSLLRVPEGWADDRRLAQLQVLLDVANRLSAPCGVTARMGRALGLVLEFLDVDSAALLEQPRPLGTDGRPKGGAPEAGAGVGSAVAHDPPRQLGARQRAGAGGAAAEDLFWAPSLVATALAKGGPALSVDDAPDGAGDRVSLCLPLGELAPDAVLYVANQARTGPYSDEDMEFITGLAGQIGIALANARALDALRDDDEATDAEPLSTE